jgi:hypothetical protein
MDLLAFVRSCSPLRGPPFELTVADGRAERDFVGTVHVTVWEDETRTTLTQVMEQELLLVPDLEKRTPAEVERYFAAVRVDIEQREPDLPWSLLAPELFEDLPRDVDSTVALMRDAARRRELRRTFAARRLFADLPPTDPNFIEFLLTEEDDPLAILERAEQLAACADPLWANYIERALSLCDEKPLPWSVGLGAVSWYFAAFEPILCVLPLEKSVPLVLAGHGRLERPMWDFEARLEQEKERAHALLLEHRAIAPEAADELLAVARRS